MASLNVLLAPGPDPRHRKHPCASVVLTLDTTKLDAAIGFQEIELRHIREFMTSNTIRRRALIIGVPKTRGLRDLPGPPIDVTRFKEFLLSDQGGSWDNMEIDMLPTGDPARLGSLMEKVSDSDYGVVYFSGHGMQNTTQEIPLDAAIYLSNGTPITVASVTPRSRQGLVIIDACRSAVSEPPVKHRQKTAMLEGLIEEEYRTRCRLLYDDLLRQNGPGTAFISSCSPGQTALDSSQGGHFTIALLDSAANYGASNKNHLALTADIATNEADEYLLRIIESPQHPTFCCSRSGLRFPFAVYPRSLAR